MKPEQQRAFVKALESTDKYSTGNHNKGIKNKEIDAETGKSDWCYCDIGVICSLHCEGIREQS